MRNRTGQLDPQSSLETSQAKVEIQLTNFTPLHMNKLTCQNAWPPFTTISCEQAHILVQHNKKKKLYSSKVINCLNLIFKYYMSAAKFLDEVEKIFSFYEFLKYVLILKTRIIEIKNK